MSSDTRRCTAIRDYVAKSDDELTFREGDVIFVPKRNPGDRCGEKRQSRRGTRDEEERERGKAKKRLRRERERAREREREEREENET